MDIEKAVKKGLICVICRQTKTQKTICNSCVSLMGITDSPKAESVIKAFLSYLIGPFTQSKVVLGGVACSSQVPSDPITLKPKYCTPDMVLYPGHGLLIIVEVDENEHAGYDPSCEASRLDTIRYGLDQKTFYDIKVFIY